MADDTGIDNFGVGSEIGQPTSLHSKDLTDKDKYGTAMIVDSSYGPSLSVNENELKFGYYRSTSKDIRMRRKRLLTVETDQMKYAATNTDNADNPENGAMSYYIGAFDPATNKIKLIDAEYYQLFPFHKDDYTDDSVVPPSNEKDMSYHEKSDRLVKEFGSAKGKRLLNARLRNEVKGEALEKAMDSAISEASVTLPSSQASHTSEDASDVMPRCYRDAKCLEESYLLSDIITESEMNALHEVSSLFADATKEQISEWRTQETYPSHVLNQLQFISPDPNQRNERARSLLYLHYMILLYNMNAAQIRKAQPLPSTVPEVIRRKLLDKFTATVQDKAGRNIRCMPKRLKDSLTLHILVLCMIIDGFHCNCTAIKKNLQLSDSRWKTLVATLGGRVKIENSANNPAAGGIKYFMLLPWPLDFRIAEKVHEKRTRR